MSRSLHSAAPLGGLARGRRELHSDRGRQGTRFRHRQQMREHPGVWTRGGVSAGAPGVTTRVGGAFGGRDGDTVWRPARGDREPWEALEKQVASGRMCVSTLGLVSWDGGASLPPAPRGLRAGPPRAPSLVRAASGVPAVSRRPAPRWSPCGNSVPRAAVGPSHTLRLESSRTQKRFVFSVLAQEPMGKGLQPLPHRCDPLSSVLRVTTNACGETRVTEMKCTR